MPGAGSRLQWVPRLQSSRELSTFLLSPNRAFLWENQEGHFLYWWIRLTPTGSSCGRAEPRWGGCTARMGPSAAISLPEGRRY